MKKKRKSFCRLNNLSYLCSRKRLGYGVMVTLQSLVLPFLVRVRVAQQKKKSISRLLFFVMHEQAWPTWDSIHDNHDSRRTVRYYSALESVWILPLISFMLYFSVYLRLFLPSLHSLFLQIDHYLLRPNSANLFKNTSQLNLK